MKTLFTMLVAIMLLIPLMTQAQDKSLIETPAQLSYDVLPNGPKAGIQTVNVDRERINQLTKELNLARMNGNASLAEQLFNELEVASGNQSVKSNGQINGPMIINTVVNEPVQETDYNMTIINGTDGNWSTANSTDRISGRIWVVATSYNSGGSDTIKLFTSTNNGISWTLLNRISFATTGIHYRPDELDIEAVNNGTTQYLFGVASFNYGTPSTAYSFYFRMNSTGAEFAFAYLATSSTTVKNYYPRISSDNSRWTSIAYVYMIWTQDSTQAADRHLKSKLSIITNPFAAAPTITNRLGGGTSGAYWWNANVATTNDSTFMYNDLAIADSLGFTKIVTVTNFYRMGGFNNLYLSYSNDFGATAPTWVPQITETKVNYRPRIAATGLDSTYMMITNTRQFSATDWDPYYYRTSNDGVNWLTGYVSALADTTFYSDVVAIPRVPNTFRFVYAVRSGSDATSNIFSRQFNNGVFLTTFQLNTTFMSGGFTPVRAGYRYSTDSCFANTEGVGGSGLYAFAGCSGAITGIGYNGSPVSFKLSQNYPNPFNPVTKIAYALPKSGLVTLRVYDILGREVAMLINEVKNAGNYSVDFNASNFTSGVYFYKLESNGFSDIKKMMLIK